MGQSSRRNWHPTLSKIDSEIKNTPPQNKVETDQSTSTELAAKAKPCVHCPHYLTCSITMRKTGVGGKACGPPLRLDRGRVTVIPGCVTYLEHPSCGVASCCCCCEVVVGAGGSRPDWTASVLPWFNHRPAAGWRSAAPHSEGLLSCQRQLG